MWRRMDSATDACGNVKTFPRALSDLNRMSFSQPCHARGAVFLWQGVGGDTREAEASRSRSRDCEPDSATPINRKRHHFYCIANKKRKGRGPTSGRTAANGKAKLKRETARCAQTSHNACAFPFARSARRSDPTLGFRAYMLKINRQPFQKFSITPCQHLTPPWCQNASAQGFVFVARRGLCHKHTHLYYLLVCVR